MEIVLYTDIDNSQKENLIKEIYRGAGLSPIMTFDFESLFNFIKLKRRGRVVILFLISSTEELAQLNAFRTHLTRLRFILILTGDAENLIEEGFNLYPRYLAYTNYGFRDVSAVLKQMVHNSFVS